MKTYWTGTVIEQFWYERTVLRFFNLARRIFRQPYVRNGMVVFSKEEK